VLQVQKAKLSYAGMSVRVSTYCMHISSRNKELDTPYPLDLFYSVHGHSKYKYSLWQPKVKMSALLPEHVEYQIQQKLGEAAFHFVSNFDAVIWVSCSNSLQVL